jgi:hypothetical protein
MSKPVNGNQYPVFSGFLLASCLLAGQAVGQAAATNAPVAVLPVTVGAEVVLAEDGPGKNTRATPAVAFGRGSYLVVWREGWQGKNGGARIRACRVGPDGARLDATPFDLAPNKDKDAPQESPRIAFCQDTFLVVWHDMRGGTHYDVLGCRISTDGKILDPEPLKIAAGSVNQTLPDVAAGLDGFLVVWQGYQEKDHRYHGYAARVGLDGKMGDANEVGIAPMLRAAWDGEHFLVTCGQSGFWGTGTAIRLGADGKPLPREKPFTVMKNTGDYSLSGVPGKGWLMVGHRSPPDNWGWGGPGAIRCFFVVSDGKVDPAMVKETDSPGHRLDPNWLDCSTKDRSVWPYGLSASAWDGKQSVVVWQRFRCSGEAKSMLANSNIMLSRADGWRRQTDVPVEVAASESEELVPALASDSAGNLLCVYEREVGVKVQICARPISSRMP